MALKAGELDENSVGRKKVRRDFIILCTICFTLFSGYGSVLVLQSSINIEGGIGVWSLMATYLGGSLFNLFFSASVIRKFGARKTMLVAELSYFLYCLVNFYPVPYLLIPAGLLVGFGEACMWPTMMIFIAHFGDQYGKYSEKDGGYYTTQLIGYFFTGLTFSQVFGNLLTWSILYAGVVSEPSNSTVDLSVCGINDCQDPNITAVNIGQYEPTNQATRYGTIGAMSGLVLISVFVSQFLLPDMKSYSEDSKDEKSEDQDSKQEEKKSILTSVKMTFKHLISVKQLLLTPLAVYVGLFQAYSYSEVTRAFVSCMRGVDQVTLTVIASNIVDGISSSIVGIVSAKYGRNVLFAIGFAINSGYFFFQLYWIPTPSTTWLIYIMAGADGIINSLLGVQTQDLHGAFFPKKREFALSAVNMYNTLGWGILFASSTSICVEKKVYIYLGLSIIAMVGYTIAYFLYRDELRHKKAEAEGEAEFTEEVHAESGTTTKLL